MEKVAIRIPGSLYTTIYQRFGDQTTSTITTWLDEMLNAATDAAGSNTSSSTRYPRPQPGTKTGRVWEIADRIDRETGSATREAVMRACMDEGLNVNTASTQFSYWRKTK